MKINFEDCVEFCRAESRQSVNCHSALAEKTHTTRCVVLNQVQVSSTSRFIFKHPHYTMRDRNQKRSILVTASLKLHNNINFPSHFSHYFKKVYFMLIKTGSSASFLKVYSVVLNYRRYLVIKP